MSPGTANWSRLAGLAGGLWIEEEPGAGNSPSSENATLARMLDGFCETLLWAGGGPPHGFPGTRVPEVEGPPGLLRALGSILAGSELDRVLFASGAATEVDRLLALVAYPRQPLVAYRPARGERIAAILCDREALLADVLEQLSAGRTDLEWLASAPGVSFLEGRPA